MKQSVLVTPILGEILHEYDKACKKHPGWPADILHQIAIVNEESGEATRAALQYVYEKGNIEEVEKELVQTATMCLRMLVGLRFEGNDEVNKEEQEYQPDDPNAKTYKYGME